MRRVVECFVFLIAGVKAFLMSFFYGNKPSRSSNPRVLISGTDGSSVEILRFGGQIVSWKNNNRDELLWMSRKPVRKSLGFMSGGITSCFEQRFHLSDMSRQHEYLRNKMWLVDSRPSLPAPRGSSPFVDLVLESTEEDMRIWPHPFELRIRIILCPGKLQLISQVKNTDSRAFSFTFSLRNYLIVSDISEVRIEGLETLDYLDNKLHRTRITEQADALTFDGEIDRSYLETPNKIVIIDHAKKRTYVLTKQNMPDAVIWSPWGKLSGDCKSMLSVDSAIVEHPITLQPNQEWRGYQEIRTVSSSYSSGQLDLTAVLDGFR